MTAVGVQVETETNSHGAGAHPDGARAPGAGATERFAQRVLGDLSAAMTGVMVRLGHELGLYRVLGEQGPLTSRELAGRASVLARYAREWLHQQRAAGYLDCDRESEKFRLAEGGDGQRQSRRLHPGWPGKQHRHCATAVARTFSLLLARERPSPSPASIKPRV